MLPTACWRGNFETMPRKYVFMIAARTVLGGNHPTSDYNLSKSEFWSSDDATWFDLSQ